MPNQAALLCYLVVGMMTFPLDVIGHSGNVWEQSGEFQGDIKVDTGDANGISPRIVIRKGWWPGGIVPYEFDPIFDDYGRWVIEEAMRTIENVMPRDRSCQLKFVPRNGHNNYIYITSFGENKCWSYFGVIGGRQNLSIGPGCLEVFIVVHELLHALGFGHQHDAPDRDQYINIIWGNVKEGEEYNFNLTSYNDFTDFGLPYDFDSIMHYSEYIYAKTYKNGTAVGPTLISKDPNVKIKINKKLSPIDIKKLHIMYCKRENQNNPTIQNEYFLTPQETGDIVFQYY